MIERDNYGRPLGHPTPMEYWKEYLDKFVKEESLNLDTFEGFKSLVQYTLILSCSDIYNSDDTVTCKLPSDFDALIEFLQQYIDGLYST